MDNNRPVMIVRGFGADPVEMECPHCKNYIQTKTTNKMGDKALLAVKINNLEAVLYLRLQMGGGLTVKDRNLNLGSRKTVCIIEKSGS